MEKQEALSARGQVLSKDVAAKWEAGDDGKSGEESKRSLVAGWLNITVFERRSQLIAHAEDYLQRTEYGVQGQCLHPTSTTIRNSARHAFLGATS